MLIFEIFSNHYWWAIKIVVLNLKIAKAPREFIPHVGYSIQLIGWFFREQTIARKWGWNDDVTKQGADEVINLTASEGVEENDDCHGQIALQADFAFATAAGQ